MKAKRMLIALLLCCLMPVAALAALDDADFTLAVGDALYALGESPEALIAAAGPMTITEADSCMFDGTDKEFASETLLLATYPIGPGGADALETIYVIGGEYVTARGIGLGATREAVIAAYGDGYTMDYDQMRYAIGDPLETPMLVFILDLETDTVAAFYMIRNTAA